MHAWMACGRCSSRRRPGIAMLGQSGPGAEGHEGRPGLEGPVTTWFSCCMWFLGRFPKRSPNALPSASSLTQSPGVVQALSTLHYEANLRRKPFTKNRRAGSCKSPRLWHCTEPLGSGQPLAFSYRWENNPICLSTRLRSLTDSWMYYLNDAITVWKHLIISLPVGK